MLNVKGQMKARIQDGVVYSPYPNVQIPLCSFYSLAKQQLQINPDNLALVDDVLSLRRGELLVRLQRYAVGFRHHGVAPCDRVCVHLNNSVENLVAMYGCVLAGATVIMAKTSLTEHELRYQVEDSDSTHVLTEAQFSGKVLAATASLNMKGLFSTGPAAGFVSVADFSSLDETEFQECLVRDPKNTVMGVYYTSGSTGMPKGAEITHHSFVGCFYTCREHLPWSATEVSLGANPITHISGLVFQIMPVLNGAVGAVVPSMSTPVEIMDAIDKYKATVMLTLPTPLHALVREMYRTGRCLPTMRHITISGTALTEWLSNAACSTFGGLRTLQNIYAMTEACLLVSAQSQELHIGERGSDVGWPAATVKVKVVDINTREKLGPNQMGEICFQSASMVKGYYKRPEESADLFDKDGWMKTGDAGYYDGDGRLYFAERLKQMIKCMENQVVPAELEEVLLSKLGDEIREISVVGVPHKEYGEAPAAAVILTDKGRQQDRSTLAEHIKATVAANLSVHKHLYGGVLFVDSFPMTESSKVNRRALARLLEQGQPSG